MPNRTYINSDEKCTPVQKRMKGRITILEYANAIGDFKVMPMVIYHSENQRIFKMKKVVKSKLPVMWQSSPKSWCTRQFFRVGV